MGVNGRQEGADRHELCDGGAVVPDEGEVTTVRQTSDMP